MSNPTIAAERIRLLIDQNNVFNPLLNVLGYLPVNIINSQSLQFELMVYDSSGGPLSDSTTVTNWNNINNLVVALQDSPNPHNATVFWSSAIAKAAINTSCSVSNWQAGTDQQVLMVIPGTVNFLNAIAQQQAKWLVVYTVSTDSTPNLYCLTAFLVTVSDSGIPAGPGVIYLLGPDGLVHPVYITTDMNGNFVLAVEQTGMIGDGISAAFLASPDHVYRTPTLVSVGGNLVITLQ